MEKIPGTNQDDNLDVIITPVEAFVGLTKKMSFAVLLSAEIGAKIIAPFAAYQTATSQQEGYMQVVEGIQKGPINAYKSIVAIPDTISHIENLTIGETNLVHELEGVYNSIQALQKDSKIREQKREEKRRENEQKQEERRKKENSLLEKGKHLLQRGLEEGEELIKEGSDAIQSGVQTADISMETYDIIASEDNPESKIPRSESIQYFFNIMKQRVQELSQIGKNIADSPIGTGIKSLISFLTYYIGVSSLARFFRLKDKNTLGDATRKKIWRKFFQRK